MPLFGSNIISNQVVKAKSDKLHKSALSAARKRIKKGELVDPHSFALYLKTIDNEYSSLAADVNNATRVFDYEKVRADKLAVTRQLLDFFTQDYAELNRLFQIVNEKARHAGKTDETAHEGLPEIDLTKLKSQFDALTREETQDGSKHK